MDVGNFLQFQGCFHCYCVVQTTTDDECIFGFRKFLRDLCHSCIYFQYFFCTSRQFMQFFYCCLESIFCHCAAYFCKVQRNQVQDGNLCCVTFCGSNCDFRTSPCVDHVITFSCDGAAYYVNDGDNFQTLSFCFSQGCQCICCFATLADDDTQFTFVQDGVSVSEFGSDIYFYRNSCNFFHHVFTNDTSMHCCTASYDVYSATVFDFFFCQRDFIQFDVCFCQTRLDCFIQHFRLFHDFLHHEVIIAAFFSCCDIPCYMVDFFFDFVTFCIEQCYAIIFQYSDLMFIQQVVISCVFQQSRNIRCDIVFAFAQTNQQGAAFTYCHQCVRVFAAHDTQRICTTDLAQQFSCSGNHVTIIQIVVQMCHYFCICFGLEYNAFFFQLCFQFLIVFNDTVVYHRNFTAHAVMRVAVCHTGFTVCCPTCMTNTNMRRFLAISFQFFSQTSQSAFYFDSTNTIFIYGNTCRVITAVFQFGQAVQQYGYCLIAANISYDSAHNFLTSKNLFVRCLSFVGSVAAPFCKKACDPERKGEEHPPKNSINSCLVSHKNGSGAYVTNSVKGHTVSSI